MGNQEYGTGLVTSYKQLVSDRLGIDADRIDVVMGDTDRSPRGLTGGSRALPVGGSALHEASLKIIEKGKQIAANLLEASAARHRVRRRGVPHRRHRPCGRSVRTSRRPRAIRRNCRAGMEPGLDTTQVQNPTGATFPNGCHIAEVEIDPDSGCHRSCATRSSTISAQSSIRCCSKARCMAASCRASGRRCWRRRSTTTTASSSPAPSWTMRCRAPTTFRTSRSRPAMCPARPTRSASRARARPAPSARRRR